MADPPISQGPPDTQGPETVPGPGEEATNTFSMGGGREQTIGAPQTIDQDPSMAPAGWKGFAFEILQTLGVQNPRISVGLESLRNKMDEEDKDGKITAMQDELLKLKGQMADLRFSEEHFSGVDAYELPIKGLPLELASPPIPGGDDASLPGGKAQYQVLSWMADGISPEWQPDWVRAHG